MLSDDYNIYCLLRAFALDLKAMETGLRLFGSMTRTRVLLAIAALRETYPREIASVLSIPLLSVQRIVDDLQAQGVVATRLRGNQRQTVLNPTWFAANELSELLSRMVDADAALRDHLAMLRRRPRRKGKPLGDLGKLVTR
jgi:DNA-binding MarR family transcriptional regulator